MEKIGKRQNKNSLFGKNKILKNSLANKYKL